MTHFCTIHPMSRDTFETLYTFVFVPAAIVTTFSLLAWLPFRKRVHWHRWEFAAPAFIVFVSMLLFPFLPTGNWRSLSNYAVELMGSMSIALLVPWFRVAIPGSTSQTSVRLAAISTFVALSLTCLLWLMMPSFPE